jgi:hypothetical protein
MIDPLPHPDIRDIIDHKLDKNLHWLQFWLFLAATVGLAIGVPLMVFTWIKIKSKHCLFVLAVTNVVSLSLLLAAIFNRQYWFADKALKSIDLVAYNTGMILCVEVPIVSLYNDFLTAWKYLQSSLIML